MGFEVFSFPANWAESVRTKITYATDVFAGDNGAECRTSLTQEPSLRAEYSVRSTEGHGQAKAIERFFRKNAGKAVLAPLWSEAVVLTATSTGASLPVESTAGTLFGAGRQAALFRSDSPELPEAFTVASVSPNAIAAAASLQEQGHAGDVVVPLIQTEPLTAATSIGWFHAAESGAAVAFDEDAAAAAAPPGNVVLPQYAGLPIWPCEANWPDDKSLRASDGVTFSELKTSSGLRSVTLLSPYPRRSLQIEAWLDDRAAIAAAVASFTASRGRLNPLWVPSQKTDFVPATPAFAGGDWIEVGNSGFVESVELGDMRRTLIVLTDAGWFVRKITDARLAVSANGDEMLHLDASLPPCRIIAMEWLYLMRFATDDLQLEFQNTDRASATISFSELANEYSAALSEAAAAEGPIVNGVLTA